VQCAYATVRGAGRAGRRKTLRSAGKHRDARAATAGFDPWALRPSSSTCTPARSRTRVARRRHAKVDELWHCGAAPGWRGSHGMLYMPSWGGVVDCLPTFLSPGVVQTQRVGAPGSGARGQSRFEARTRRVASGERHAWRGGVSPGGDGAHDKPVHCGKTSARRVLRPEPGRRGCSTHESVQKLAPPVGRAPRSGGWRPLGGHAALLQAQRWTGGVESQARVSVSGACTARTRRHASASCTGPNPRRGRRQVAAADHGGQRSGCLRRRLPAAGTCSPGLSTRLFAL
jgi:hypothetical protein